MSLITKSGAGVWRPACLALFRFFRARDVMYRLSGGVSFGFLTGLWPSSSSSSYSWSSPYDCCGRSNLFAPAWVGFRTTIMPSPVSGGTTPNQRPSRLSPLDELLSDSLDLLESCALRLDSTAVPPRRVGAACGGDGGVWACGRSVIRRVCKIVQLLSRADAQYVGRDMWLVHVTELQHRDATRQSRPWLVAMRT